MNRIIFYIFLITAIFLLQHCAKEASPTGGPKDYDPPVVEEEQPPNYKTNFTENKIKIYFNEFVKLKNLRQELLISPPFKEQPKMIIKGKKLVINLPDSLPENRTVNMNFYNAIVDVNEENVLKNYQYIFSTDSMIDTSFIDGRLTDAQTGKPVKDELVFMYQSFDDSVVSQESPDYIARSGEEGIFVVNSLGKGPYKTFALKDKNRNNLYDQPAESVAFLKDSVKPSIEWTTMTDTLQLLDSVSEANNDTIYRDSVITHKVQVSSLKPFQLRMFVKDYKKHYLTTSKRVRKSLIALGFNRSVDNFSYDVALINTDSEQKSWYKMQKMDNDSVLLWITDSTLYKSDSVYAAVTYPYTDSTNQVIQRTDSIYFTYDFENLSQKDTTLHFKRNLRQNKLDIDTTLRITFSEPIKDIDSNLVQMFIKPDTAYVPYDYNLSLSENRRQLSIHHEQDLYSQYKLLLDSAAIQGMYGNVNDSVVLSYQYFEKADYGNFILNPDTLPVDAIFLLYAGSNNKPYVQKRYPKKQQVKFNQLPPGKYHLKVLIDRNRNQKWDTGNYYEGKLPELVIAFPKELVVKANWDTEQTWELSQELKLYE